MNAKSGLAAASSCLTVPAFQVETLRARVILKTVGVPLKSICTGTGWGVVDSAWAARVVVDSDDGQGQAAAQSDGVTDGHVVLLW